MLPLSMMRLRVCALVWATELTAGGQACTWNYNGVQPLHLLLYEPQSS